MPRKIESFKRVEEEFGKFLLMADEGIIKLVCASIIANRIGTDPVWLLILGASSSGKCLGKGTEILMHNGSIKKVEDIKVGDLIMGDDSSPRKILSLARGEEMMYEVQQRNGDNYIVNESHILSLKKTTARKRHGLNDGDVIDIPLTDYLSISNHFKSMLKGYKVGVEFKNKKLNIDPYFLGAWLGDGRSNGLSICKPDKEIINYLKEYAKSLGLKCSVYDYGTRCPETCIIGRDNKLKLEFEKLNLFNNKHIPNDYIINSRENRLKLLAGLLDSDGYLSKKNNEFEFVNKNKNIAYGIVFLSRSLGFTASIRKVKKGIKSINFMGEYYRVFISKKIWEIPTKIKRKQATKRELTINKELTYGIKLEKLKVDSYYGFEIDGNKRFLLGDFTVTHNTEIVRAFDDLEYTHQIDLITTNTFASGMRRGKEETSLLHKINGGILIFKDFTTLLSMNKEGLNDIMGQFRSIYDGAFNKSFGTGETVAWVGKIGVIAAGTIECQRTMRHYSKNGERFINYIMKQPDRMEVMKVAAKNQKDIKEKRDSVKSVVSSYIDNMCEKLIENNYYVNEKVQQELFEIANFSTLARSPVILNFKTNAVEFVPDPEMPTRVSAQLINLANVFMGMNDGELTVGDKKILYKIALDSVPVHRRMVFGILTKYKSATTKSVALSLNYPTETVRIWLTEIDALKLCTRKAKGEGMSDTWTLDEKWRSLLSKFDDIKVLESELTEDNVNGNTEEVDNAMIDEANKELEGNEEWTHAKNLMGVDEDEDNEQISLGLNDDE